MSRMLQSFSWPTARVGVCFAITMLAGCGSGKSTGTVRDHDSSTPVNTGLANLDNRPGLALPTEEELMQMSPEQASIQERIAEAARQLEFLATNVEINGPSDLPIEQEPESRLVESSQTSIADPITTEQPTQPNPSVNTNDDGGVRVSLMELAGDTEVKTLDPDKGTDTPVKQEPALSRPNEVSSSLDPQVRRDALASELASILSEMVSLGTDPGASALALASLETLLPADTETLVDTGVLSEPELATINAVRGLLASMTSEGDLVSPNRLATELEYIQQQLEAWAGLTIERAALCTRVDGFGRYETFPSYRFIAGQAHEIIVYTEVEHFAQEKKVGPDGAARFGIELSQRLELYHVADDLNTWNRAAERIQDESRNRLRDYYLTNRVWLPANLGVGRYNLKVVMRDLVGDKVAESVIPIEIVSQ